MNRNIVCARSVLRFLNRSFSSSDNFVHPRCLTHFIKPYKSFGKLNSRTSSVFKNLSRRASSSNSDPKSSETDDSNQNALDNEEFQNILKDFSRDFGLGSDSENLLNDIKKSLNENNDHAPSSSSDGDLNSSSNSSNTEGALSETYKSFFDSDSVIIQSYEDIVSGACADDELIYHVDQPRNITNLTVDTKRGISGVFDIAELVEVLRNENLTDIAVISIPKELHYADFLVLANAKSPRHSKAVSEYVIKLYKMKKHKKDPFIIVEGEKVSNWKALDMGNIVLHVFLEETRTFYDLESLWLFDSEFDSGGTLKPDPVFDALQEQIAFFHNLQSSSLEETKNESIKETT